MSVFNALHGRFGEDGTIQGVLDYLGIPYTHSGVRASALAMDKAAAKAVFAAAGLPVAPHRIIDVAELADHDPLPPPYVVKPVNEGSSVGVYIVKPGDNGRAKIVQEWHYGPAMAELYVPGRELTVGVLDDRALAVTEILPAAKILRLSRQICGGRVAPRGAGGTAGGDHAARQGNRTRGAPGAGLPRRVAGGFAL